MTRYSIYGWIFCLTAGTMGGILIGCRQNEPPNTATPDPNSSSAVSNASPANAPESNSNPGSASTEVHGHQPGLHGGIIIPVGADSYHAEAVVEKNGSVRLLMLGKDETRIQEVEMQALKAYIKTVGATDAIQVELAAVPQDGDSENKTSQFVGQLPDDLQGRPLEVTIPNLRIGEERFRVGFTTASAVHEETMPEAAVNDEERTLYLTPAGQYTQDDIQANGNVTASVKFKGIPSVHDNKPMPGDRICPVSLTKANPKFTWIIGGKPYQFCCPPCIDEFLKQARSSAEMLQDPDSYIK